MDIYAPILLALEVLSIGIFAIIGGVFAGVVALGVTTWRRSKRKR